MHFLGFPGGLEGKVSACNAGDPGLIPESGRSPGEGNGTPLQYSCLENPMDRGPWEAAIPESGRSPGEGNGTPTPVLLPGKSHGRRGLGGCSPWGRKESDTTEQLHFDF